MMGLSALAGHAELRIRKTIMGRKLARALRVAATPMVSEHDCEVRTSKAPDSLDGC